MTSPTTPTVVARSLRKTFGEVVALDGLDMTVQPGEIVGLIGPSGSGKTTAVRLVIGAYEPSAGELFLWGEPAGHLSPDDRRRIGYLPQHPALLPDLSIEENLHFHASLSGVPRRARRGRFDETLRTVGLSDALPVKARDASGGMQRRVALAAALLHEPDVLVLDEPTAGIDPVLRRQLWDHFEALRAEGRTLLVTTQYVGEALHCDRVAVIVEGRLLAFETPRGLRHRVYGGDILDVVFDDDVPSEVASAIERHLPGSTVEFVGRSAVAIVVEDAGPAVASLGSLFDELDRAPVSMEERIIDFDEMFVQLVSEQSEGTSVATDTASRARR